MHGFDITKESAKGEAKKPGFNVFNRFGQYGKGEFEFKYGLNAPAVTGFGQVKEKSIVIKKKGQRSCPAGQKLTITGGCVPEIQDLACEPGWIKENGVCVKGPTEFLTTKKGIPQYYQELQNGEGGGFFGVGMGALVFVGLLIVAGFLVVKRARDTEERQFRQFRADAFRRNDGTSHYGLDNKRYKRYGVDRY
jgi:hypothetical protein